jgi:two-component system, OmpR family, copper resistance phosphate regulon response regulator CusR
MAKILVIEDNPAVRILTKDLLENANHEVDTASDGTEGREKIKNNTPDLVVLDLTLPDDFGLDICRDVKKTNPSLLIFMLTALGNSQDVVAGLEAGADDYLPKPFNQREFIARVNLLVKKAGKT